MHCVFHGIRFKVNKRLGCRETALLAFYKDHSMKTTYQRIHSSIKLALPKSAKTIIWLLKVILPISLIVSLLHHFGVIAFIAIYLEPLFQLIGLPGESAIVFLTSFFLTLYAPIAIMATLPLEMREITILALMCLITHNLFIETSIQKKTGSSYPVMFFLRLFTSFLAAWLLNLMLPEDMGKSMVVEKAIIHPDILSLLIHWAKGAVGLIIKIVLIVTGLMILQNILKEFKIMEMISKTFAPMMKIFGLSKDSSFLWFVAQITGLTYGSAIMIEQTENNEISRKDSDLLNHHIAINHSLLEDTLLFVAIGVPVFWITIPRILLAMVAVWTAKLVYNIFSKKNITQNLQI